MRISLAVAGIAALVAVSSPASAPTAVSTVSCAQVGAFFTVTFTGNIAGSFSGDFYPIFGPVPRSQTMVALWTYGSQTTAGPVMYGWLTHGTSRLSKRCARRTARPPTAGQLRPRLRVQDGWAYGKRYECRQRGRLVIRTDVRGAASRLTAWMEKSRELVATAEIGAKSGWIRVSKRCLERDL